ncbi:MAG: SRPBCC family protein [Xanthomonadales bacterium]|nr:SRPBCC family protein [Gammaproteobacteria bacterium]MBT8053211.1 SRPBCC family protein [Gammaproteobacteria bacterium]NND57187.1 SRPBCC family protein [Xanthomonadales bacterium]NNK50251.1 SRPBCC family protein [Xanthomonadales bacterium]
MRELTEQIAIARPRQNVWELLADFGGVAAWAPYMKTSHLIGDVRSGVGMRRGMKHAWGFRFEEAVTDWQDGKGFSFDVFRAPFPMTDVRESWFLHHENGLSTVSTRVTYRMKLGPLGKAIDWLLVRFIVKREMRAGLQGLKQHSESR